MKISIALTLVIVIAVFSFVSGYSIGSHNKHGSSIQMTSLANAGSIGTAKASTNSSTPPSGGYGSPSSEKAGNSGSSPGYGAPSPGYGQ